MKIRTYQVLTVKVNRLKNLYNLKLLYLKINLIKFINETTLSMI